MKILNNEQERFIKTERFYFVHGEGFRTQVVFATQRILRSFKLAGFPDIKGFRLEADLYDLRGNHLAQFSYETPSDQEVCFDSADVFRESEPATKLEGSVLLSIASLELKEELDPKANLAHTEDFNGVLLIYKPGRFVTGVHMYHGVEFRSFSFLAKYYLKNKIRKAARRLQSFLRSPMTLFRSGPWPFDAVGATIIHASPSGGAGLALIHSDNRFPGFVSFLEHRLGDGASKRFRFPAVGTHATLKQELPPLRTATTSEGEWGQILCAYPPLGVSRFLAGEQFADGSFCIDHTYFQQAKDTKSSKVKSEVKFFKKELLRAGDILGPSHPWPCIHNDQVESLIAICNQLFPDEEHVYDLHIFDNDGRVTLSRKACIRVKPYGLEVFSISEELKKIGLRTFEGTYLVSHSAENRQEFLPNRLHAQGIYRFGKKFWNSVQSDSSIWSSPSPPLPDIEALSWGKVRRKQYWLAPVIESEDLETLLPIANLSYSLHYNQKQVLGLRYCEGNRILQEEEVEIKPFGATIIPVRKLFSKSFDSETKSGLRAGSVLIYPKTGMTYCASLMVREKKSQIFMMEHVLPVKKLPHEISP